MGGGRWRKVTMVIRGTAVVRGMWTSQGVWVSLILLKRSD